MAILGKTTVCIVDVSHAKVAGPRIPIVQACCATVLTVNEPDGRGVGLPPTPVAYLGFGSGGSSFKIH